MISLTSPSTAPTTVLEKVAQPDGPRPDPTQVTIALLDAERAAKKHHAAVAVESLLGNWRLCFTAPKKPAYKAGQPEGKGFYWPAIAPGSISFNRPNPTAEALTIQNQLRVGPLRVLFTGPAKFSPKKNLLAFDFVQLQLFGGSQLLLNFPLKGKAASPEEFQSTAIGKLPFFAFFAATEHYMAARGRGGGLALWVKDEDAKA